MNENEKKYFKSEIDQLTVLFDLVQKKEYLFDAEKVIGEGTYTTAFFGNKGQVVSRELDRDECIEHALSSRHLTELSCNLLIAEIAGHVSFDVSSQIEKTSCFNFHFKSESCTKDDFSDESSEEYNSTYSTSYSPLTQQSDPFPETLKTNHETLSPIDPKQNDTSIQNSPQTSPELCFIRPEDDSKSISKDSQSSWETFYSEDQYPAFLTMFHGYGGKDLSSIIRSKKSNIQDWEKYCESVAQHILQHLVLLHVGISTIHGDIKPNNVVVNEHGIACLIDYNLARVGINHENIVFADTDIPMYNSYFRPLEMWSDEFGHDPVHVTSQSDMWAFGMFLVCLVLKNDIPFPSSKSQSLSSNENSILEMIENIANISNKCHLSRGKQILKLIEPHFQFQVKQKKLVTWISKCLQKEPLQRSKAIELLNEPKHIVEIEMWKRHSELQYRALARKGWMMYPDHKNNLLQLINTILGDQNGLHVGKGMDLFECLQGKFAQFNTSRLSLHLSSLLLLVCIDTCRSLYQGVDTDITELNQEMIKVFDFKNENQNEHLQLIQLAHRLVHAFIPTINMGFDTYLEMIHEPEYKIFSNQLCHSLKPLSIKQWCSDFTGYTARDLIRLKKM